MIWHHTLVRWFLSISVVFFSVYSWAAEIATYSFDSSASYTKDLQKKADFPDYMEKMLTSRAMLTMMGRDGEHPVSSLDMMTRIFISSKFGASDRRLVLAIAGIKISDQLKYDVIYNHPKGYVIHYKTKSSDIALFFKGFDLSAVNETHQEILKSKERIARLELSPFRNLVEALLPMAVADDEPAVCGGATQTLSQTGASDASILKSVWGCTKGLAGGVWDGSAGPVWSLVKGGTHALIHPVEAFDKASTGIANIAAVMSDLKGAFGQLKSAFEALPDEVKWKLGCDLVSTVGTTGLIAYFSLGAGSPMMLQTIAQALNKIVAALPAGSAVATQTLALATKMGAKASQMAEVQHFIAQGSEGKDFVDKVKKFDNVILDVERTHLDLDWAMTHPKTNRGGKIIDTINESASFYRAVATRDALQKSDPAFMNALYAARKINSFSPAGPEERARVLKELEKSVRLTAAQKSAAAAYLAAQGCYMTSKVSEALGSGTIGKDKSDEAEH